MRLLFVVIIGCLLFPGRGVAQEESVATATSALQSVLSTLKQSVDQLRMDNEQLAAKDKDIKQQLLQLQLQLEHLKTQGEAMKKAAAPLQESNARRAQQITRLEGDNFDLDNRIQKTEGGIKLAQQSLDAGYREDQQLLLHLKDLSVNAAPLPQAPSPESQAAEHRQKEKLRLMKMIYDSQQRQESLHEAISEFQKNTPMLPVVSAMAHQQLLKDQIKDLEAQIAAYPPEKFSANYGLADQWDDDQLHQLESELKVLEKNYAQLKNLMGQMDKKAEDTRITVPQRVEQDKLQANIEDLNRQGVGLRADLDDLRSQMIDLDKRKSHLEVMVRQLP